MMHARSHRGFALVYAMLVSVSFLIFFAALVYSSRDTMRAVSRDENLVKARALAATGNELAFHLLRSKGPDWIQDENFSFSNEPGAGDYFTGINDPDLIDRFSPEQVGGVFRVRLVPTEDSEADDLVIPEGGTYLVMECVAEVAGRRTEAENSSRFLIKMGVPFVNNLACTSGTMRLGKDCVIRGPVFVTQKPPKPGHLDITTHLIKEDETNPGVQNVSTLTAGLAGVLQAKGDIRLVARGPDGIVSAVVVPNGSYQNGDQQLAPLPPVGGTVFNNGIGGLEFTGPTEVQSGVSLQPRVPDTVEVFRGINSLSTRQAVDISSYPDGVLLEINGSTATLYQAHREELGRVYDLALVLSMFEGPLPSQQDAVQWLQNTYGGPLAGYRAAIAEAAWNDPDFPEEALPASVRSAALTRLQTLDPGATLADIPSTGDYFDQYSITRGPIVLSNISIPGGEVWKVLILTSDRRTSVDDQGNPISPPVFVRGELDGRLLVAYDYRETLDIHEDPIACDINVLGDPDGGTPGGLVLKDRTVVTDYSDDSEGSDDQFMAISRGTVKPHRLPLLSLGWVCPPANRENRLNLLTAALPSLSQESKNWMEPLTPAPLTEFYGISAGAILDLVSGSYTANGRPALRGAEGVPGGRVPHSMSIGILRWNELTGPRDPMLLAGNKAWLPTNFRCAYRPRAIGWRTLGAHSALEPTVGNSSLFGVHDFDYRWRALSAEVLLENLGLPVGPILVDRQGG